MMRNGLLYVLAALLIGAAGQARPLPAEGDRPGTAKQAQQYLAQYADCLVRQRSYRARVATFLRDVPGSAKPNSAQIVEPQCLGNAARETHATVALRIPPDLFRLALYAALYKRDYGRTGPVTAISAAPPAQLSTEFDGPPDALPADYHAVRELGDCVSRASPAGAHALLIAGPFTPAEDAAVEQLKPALQACIRRDQTLRLNRGALRGALGEAAYKLAISVQPPRR